MGAQPCPVKLAQASLSLPSQKRNPKQTSRLQKVLREATTTQTATIKLRKSEKTKPQTCPKNTFSTFSSDLREREPDQTAQEKNIKKNPREKKKKKKKKS